MTKMADDLTEALVRQEALVKDVKSLRLTVRLLVGVITVAVAVLVFVGITAVYARSAADTAQKSLDGQKALTVELVRQACVLRNTNNASTRATFNAFVDQVDRLTSSAAGHEAVKELRAAIPSASAQDKDCSNPPNGLGPDDYAP